MKKIKQLLSILLCLIGTQDISAQTTNTVSYTSMRAMIDNITHVFKDNHPELNYFKYHLVSTDGNIYDWYNGKNDETNSTTFMLSYLTAVKDLELSNYNANDNSVNVKALQRNMIKHLQNGLTPISLSFVEYYDFKDSTIRLNLVNWANNQFTETILNGYYPFVKKKFFSASALNHVIKMPQFNFYLDDSLIQSNIRNKIDSVYINFDDNNGFIPIQKGNLYQVYYNSRGLKNCIMKLKSDATYYYSKFQIYDSTMVNTLESIAGNDCITPINPPSFAPTPISAYNNSGQLIKGRYAVWYSTCNSAQKIRKPYIISAGFNPGHGLQLVPYENYLNDINVNINGTSILLPITFGWRGTSYEAYNGGYNKRSSPLEAKQCKEGSSNGNKYLDRLRDEGYDVIILMYDNGVDYLENNAVLFEELVNKINVQKYANGYYFENVVSGYSAGGLSTRLALAKMEYKYKNGLGPNPHTKLWVSMDGEFQGANVPLGLQYLIDFQSNPANVLPTVAGGLNGLQVLSDNINRIAADIAQGFNGNVQAKSITVFTSAHPSGITPERTNFLNALNSIPGSFNGYPTFVRRVGVGQGSTIGTKIPYTSNIMFNSQLKLNPFGDSYTASDCKGSYTVYKPVAVKTTTARWWGSNNPNDNIFDGNVYVNSTWTFLKRQCTSGSIFGIPYCLCFGPFEISGTQTTIGDQHIPKPTNPVNYDDAPASTLSAHLELYGTSAYGFYNNWFAGNSSAGCDPTLHSFAPTVSTLDLHDPSTGLPLDMFRSPALAVPHNGLDLMNINNKTGVTRHSQLRFGFPYLKYPNNHYQVTPFDAVFATGTDNGTNSDGTISKPDNQLHVLDAQTQMGDYLARVEVAPTNLYLTNQLVGSSASTNPSYTGGYIAEFEARDKIIMGKTDVMGNNIYSLYNNENYLSPNGDFGVSIGAKAIIHCGDQIELLPGLSIPIGANMDMYIKPYNCANVLYRVNNGGNNSGSPDNNPLPYKGFDYDKPLNKVNGKKINSFLLYPNPNNGRFTYVNVCEETTSTLTITDISGNIVYVTSITNNSAIDLELNQLSNGFYLATVTNKTNFDTFKLVINH